MEVKKEVKVAPKKNVKEVERTEEKIQLKPVVNVSPKVITTHNPIEIKEKVLRKDNSNTTNIEVSRNDNLNNQTREVLTNSNSQHSAVFKANLKVDASQFTKVDMDIKESPFDLDLNGKVLVIK